MELKHFFLSAGPKGNELHTEVTLNGVLKEERLTPKLAIRAALVAFGHRCGVRVRDEFGAGYRVYAHSYRKWDLGDE